MKRPTIPAHIAALASANERARRAAVNNAIASSNRHGRRIGAREARMIHALLAPRPWEK
jgi:hypothetical protein